MLRKNVTNFNDVNYNFQMLDRLLIGQQLDGDHIRELPALKITGRLGADQITVGQNTSFEQGYDPGELSDLAWSDQVQLAQLGTTIIEGGYLQTILINANSIQAGIINADLITVGTLKANRLEVGGITQTELGSGSVINIKLSTDAVDGRVIAANTIAAEHIIAGAVTANKISVTNLSALSANMGEVWVGTDKIRLGSDGIRIYGTGNLSFYDSGNWQGSLDSGSGFIRLYTQCQISLLTIAHPILITAGGAQEIRFSTGGAIRFASGHLLADSGSKIGPYSNTAAFLHFRTRNIGDTGNIDHYFAPTTGNWGYLGTSTYYWFRVYANTYYGKTSSIQSFFAHDDIALVKAIGHKEAVDKQGNRRQVIDEDTLPPELIEINSDTNEKFINMGSLSSLALGAIKQLSINFENRLNAIERRLNDA